MPKFIFSTENVTKELKICDFEATHNKIGMRWHRCWREIAIYYVTVTWDGDNIVGSWWWVICALYFPIFAIILVASLEQQSNRHIKLQIISIFYATLKILREHWQVRFILELFEINNQVFQNLISMFGLVMRWVFYQQILESHQTIMDDGYSVTLLCPANEKFYVFTTLLSSVFAMHTYSSGVAPFSFSMSADSMKPKYSSNADKASSSSEQAMSKRAFLNW